MNHTVAVRFAFGVVSESRREAHLAALPEIGETPSSWTTFCGLDIPTDQAEVSSKPAGMPCVTCMAARTAPAGPMIEAESS